MVALLSLLEIVDNCQLVSLNRVPGPSMGASCLISSIVAGRGVHDSESDAEDLWNTPPSRACQRAK